MQILMMTNARNCLGGNLKNGRYIFYIECLKGNYISSLYNEILKMKKRLYSDTYILIVDMVVQEM